jgi:hypothetical protein
MMKEAAEKVKKDMEERQKELESRMKAVRQEETYLPSDFPLYKKARLKYIAKDKCSGKNVCKYTFDLDDWKKAAKVLPRQTVQVPL